MMRKHILLLFIVLLAAVLSGCIVTKTPSSNNVVMSYGETKYFSVKVALTKDKLYWYIDNVPVAVPDTTTSIPYMATGGSHTIICRAVYHLERDREDTAVWYITSNTPPTASAGTDQVVGENVTVTLDGSNSYDPDADIVSYAWVQTDGPSVALSDAGAAKPTFTSPIVGMAGASLSFQLTVTDATDLTSTATTIVNVSWSNAPPVAKAGPNQHVDEEELVTLDASASTDADDGIAAYNWEQIAGPLPFVTLSDASAVNPTFTSPAVGQSGEALVFKLTVTDIGGLKSTDTVIINDSWSNMPPVTIAGPDQTKAEGTLVTLDASASYDTDDGIASYAWAQTGGASVTLSNPHAIKPTFTTPDIGMAGDTLTFELTVTDRGGLMTTDTVEINVTWVNAPPVAEAGANQKAIHNSTVTLNGTGSTDPDDGIATYLWEQTGGPSVTLVNADTDTASFDANVAMGSVLTFRLTVTDNNSLTSSDTCTVSVIANPIFVKISGGFYFSAAIKADGTLWTWGRNTYGQLGDGTTAGKSAPIQIGTDSNWASVSAGDNHVAAIKTDGSLWAWGYNASGQLGDGTTAISLTPKRIGTASDWVMIDAGANHTVALKEDTSIWAWGDNSKGQIGDGTTTGRLAPTRIGASNSWVMIEAGAQHTAAIDANGKLWAWGYNYYGQLGLGDTSDRHVPVQVGTDTNWKFVNAGNSHTVAIKADATLFAWGSNSNGQLGLGDTSDRNSPAQVGTDADWGKADAGPTQTVAVKTDGTLWAWGLNGNGQLGLGDTTDRLSPVQVGSDTDWASADSGYYASMGLKGGSLYTWGKNNNGQLGDGTTTDQWVPELIW
jgi:alpha-tubulin suppressor-like RCC1 family protein